MNQPTSLKVIKNKLGLLELSKELGNVSRACKIFGYSRDSFYRFKKLYEEHGEEGLQMDCFKRDKHLAQQKMIGYVKDRIIPFLKNKFTFSHPLHIIFAILFLIDIQRYQCRNALANLTHNPWLNVNLFFRNGIISVENWKI